MDQIELLFLGTGTSAGVPMIGCHCAVCSSADPHDRRNRPSVVISYAGLRVLVDSTPELRLQCVTNGVDMIDAVVYTHAHADHIMGLDDLRRFNALRGGPLDVWADAQTYRTLQQCFKYAFEDPPPDLKVFRPRLEPRTITGPFAIGPATWTPIRLTHNNSYVLGFRVGNLAYCTDVSAIPDEAWPMLEGLDVLILGALAKNKHPSHFSIDEAVAAAERIGATRTLFTHIGHTLPHEQTNRSLPPTMRLAHDGQLVEAKFRFEPRMGTDGHG
jgi:phosphoribosyl 1,2-cyclic phosphate phosphodiesterase